MTVGAISLAIVLAVVAFSKTAHAGLLSFLASVVGQQASAEVKLASASDSQVSPMIVLQASSYLAQADAQTAQTPVEGDTALSPQIASMNATSTDDVNTQISIYTVRGGDTISSVAKMFGVSVSTILWANDLTSRSTLQPGQTLVILPVTGITYTVKKGDTIQGIAKKYGADVGDILSYNDMTISTALRAGDQIIIPDAEVPNRSAAPAASSHGRITKAPYEPLLDGWGWPSYPGYYSCPLPGARVTQGLHGHNAVDLAAPRGSSLRAAAAGTVIIDRANGAWNGGYGNFVVILHPNGTQTLYAHMQRSAVQNGEQVSQGQVIGYVGMTGLTTGPHVHFELRGAQNPFADPALCR